ncbi:MAG: carboxylesterase family protein [Verrucomicrobiaceae bacterium]|nr:carboxylesterase family protein [Verrucomicrobiaceae bacterium]
MPLSVSGCVRPANPCPSFRGNFTYVFNTLSNSDQRPADQKFANQITDYWVQFARTGNPNHKDAPQWPVYDLEQRHYLNLGEDYEVRTRLKERECDVIDAASSITR